MVAICGQLRASFGRVHTLLLVILLRCGSTTAWFTLHEVEDPEAVCLDGSPYKFYFSPDPTGMHDEWYIHLEVRTAAPF